MSFHQAKQFHLVNLRLPLPESEEVNGLTGRILETAFCPVFEIGGVRGGR